MDGLLEEDEILILRHSVLNGNSYSVEELVEDTLKLERYASGRKIIPGFEGDLVQVSETGEIILTHQNFVPVTKAKFSRLERKNVSTTLDEVLDKFSVFREKNPDQKIILCLEPKTITSKDTILKTIKTLKENNFENVYFDSFFGWKLDVVDEGNGLYGTDYKKSFHVPANLYKSNFPISFPPRRYDYLSVQDQLSFGHDNRPIIYGGVGTTDSLERLSSYPNTVGIYLRLKESFGAKGFVTRFWNSISNTQDLRGKFLSRYEENDDGR